MRSPHGPGAVYLSQAMPMKMTQHEWLDQVKAEAKEKGLDFITLVVAKNFEIPYEQVSRDQRERMKSMLFGYNYGVSPADIASTLFATTTPTFGVFIDLHNACATLESETVAGRVEEFVDTYHGCWIAAVGGFPMQKVRNVMRWAGQVAHTATIRKHLGEGLGLSAVLTFMNKNGHILEGLGDICAERGHDWAFRWMTLSLLFSDVPLHVELAFARDTRFFLSWPVTKEIGQRRVFMASGTLKDWAKFVANADDPDFDAPTRAAMQEARRCLNLVLPTTSLEQHFMAADEVHEGVLKCLPLEGRKVLEIGAGHGELTGLILEHPVEIVHAYEIDPDLRMVSDARLTWMIADALTIDPAAYKGFCLISNPPYQLLTKVLELIKAAEIEDVMLLIPVSREGEFIDLGYRRFGVLSGADFTPPSKGLHIIVVKGFGV